MQEAALPARDSCQDQAAASSGRCSPPEQTLLSSQDKSDALSTAELWEELALHTLSEQREVFLLPTSATWDSLSTANSILHVKNLLVTLLSQTLSTLLQGEGSQPRQFKDEITLGMESRAPGEQERAAQGSAPHLHSSPAGH